MKKNGQSALLNMVGHIYNPNIWEAEAGGCLVWRQGRHKRFKYSMMYNSLELRQPQTWVLKLLPGHSSSWLWATMEAWREATFIFWTGPPRRTTVVHDSTRGYVGVRGSCCFPRQRWSLRSTWTYTVCAAVQCLGDVLRLCCLGAPSLCEWHV